MAVTAFDLAQLENLSDGSLPQTFLDLIKKCRSGMSIIRDLQEAQDYIQSWDIVVSEGAALYGPFDWDRDPHTKMLAASLLRSGVITFCRAVDNGSEGRAALNIGPLMADSNYKSAKERITLIRNEGIGHYGPISKGNNPSVDDMVLIVDDETCTARVNSPFSKYYSSQDVMMDLRMLVGKTLPHAHKWNNSNFDRMRLRVKGYFNAKNSDLITKYPISLPGKYIPEIVNNLIDPKQGIWFPIKLS